MDITQEDVKKHFSYTHEGKLLWKKGLNGRAKVGKEAGYVCRFYGYRMVGFKSRQTRVHRLIFLYHHGYLPECIDHIDGDTLNNRIENLREATVAQNQMNRRKRLDSKYKFKGVEKLKYGKYRAYISMKGKRTHIGVFNTEEEAATAYNIAAISEFKEYSRLNKI